MCRWLAWQGNPLFLEELIFKPARSLVAQSILSREAKTDRNADGFGIGWYAHRPEPCIYRDILPAWSDENLKSIAGHVRSPAFFAHVRASTGTATTRTNCHPFGHERLLFMHNGQIGGYENIRRQVDSLITDDFYTLKQGTTDSEALFLLALSLGLASDPLTAIHGALLRVRELCRFAGNDEPTRFTAAISDGETLFAFRYSSDCYPPSLYCREAADGLLVVSEPLDDEDYNWRPVPPNHVLIGKGGRVRDVRPFNCLEEMAA